MPTQEERLSTLEQTVTVLRKDIQDLNHHVTILLGVTSEQGKDIRGIKVNLVALNERVGAFEQNVNTRFEALDNRVSGLDSRIETFEQSVNSRFEEHGKKLDQVLFLLNSVIPRSEQES